MAGVSGGHFAGSFLRAYTAAQQQRQQDEQNKKEIDARVKLFEIQLQRAAAENAAAAAQGGAQRQLMERLSGSSPLQSIPGQQLLSPQPQVGLTDLLADPKNAALILQSGYGKELIDLNEQNPANAAARVKATLAALTPGGQPPGVAPGPAGGPTGPVPVGLGATPPALPIAPGASAAPPGGFQVRGVKLDARGNPMIDLSPPTIKQWVPSPDGKMMLGLDDSGNTIATRLPGPSEQPAEDRPMPTADILKYRDAQGQPPQPGMTQRQISAGGYTPITPAQETSEDLRSTAKAVMNKLDYYVDRIFTAGPGSRYLQATQHLYQRATQSNPDVTLYEKLSAGTLPTLLRSLGARGTLNEKEIEKALNLLPKTFPVPDTRDVALEKMQQLREILNAAATPGGPERGAGKSRKTIPFHELPAGPR